MTTGPGLALEKLFSLTVATHRFMEQGLVERGLTRARASVLWNLAGAGPMTQRSLADAIAVTPRNVTGLVDALEADGFVVRAPHPDDRRALLVTLTSKGRAAIDRITADYDQGAAYIFDGLTPADLDAFARTADHVLARIAEVPPDVHQRA